MNTIAINWHYVQIHNTLIQIKTKGKSKPHKLAITIFSCIICEITNDNKEISAIKRKTDLYSKFTVSF